MSVRGAAKRRGGRLGLWLGAALGAAGSSALDAQEVDLPSTEARVPGFSVIVLLDDDTSLEGFVWFEGPEALYCATGYDIACGGSVPQSVDPVRMNVPLACSGGIGGSIDVVTVPAHDGASYPVRGSGALDDGRSLVALFGPFRILDGAACQPFTASEAPEEDA